MIHNFRAFPFAFVMRAMDHMVLFALTIMALASLALTTAATAQTGGFGSGETNISARFVTEVGQPKPGETTNIALVMKPKPTWHGYWVNPGDAGIPTTLEWTLPDGVSVGELRYPVPETLNIAGIMNYVYEGEYALLLPLTLDDSIAPGTILPLSAKAEWLACTDEVCVPESQTITLSVTAGSGAQGPETGAVGTGNAALKDQFNLWRARMPAPLGNEAQYSVNGETIRISIPLPESVKLEDAYFFSETDGIIDYSAPQKLMRGKDVLIIETGAYGAGDGIMQGVLRIGDHQGLSLIAKDAGEGSFAAFADGTSVVANGGGGASSGATAAGSVTTFFYAFGGALLGGLLLNIFPCVFPILSLKAISLAKAGGAASDARRDALAYTAGIILFCLLLGGAMLGLRALGAQIGWGFQLQDPRIIFVLLILFTAISLNLAGLFEFGTISVGNDLAGKGGAQGAFWTGALAALVATPCSAPFMAGAIGAAILLPPAAGLLVFAGLGLGLALPFLLLGFVPVLRKMMPRPGPWMDTFRRIMSIPMFFSLLALIWLLGQQIGNDGLLLALAATLSFGLFLWWYGIRQNGGASRNWLPLAPGFAVAIAALLLLPLGAASDKEQQVASDETLPSMPFSEGRLADLRAEGRPVFAYFTADWCITCKANEAAAVQRTATAEVFKAAEVAVLKGDWTRQDAEITRYLEEHGRSGVPLYVYYEPGAEPHILPQVLTVEMLTALVS
jgi:DsbC/DsbD-like thiol-disulfide interchange protein/cytochrome c biogenesis protein CcdA